MTALVYLRSSFGFTLLRPRSIFFALSFAVGVLDYIAFHEPEIWTEYWAVCIFAGGAVILYWIHFTITFIRELYRNGKQDDYPGTSHALRLFGGSQHSSALAQMNVHLWLEPGVVLAVAAVLRFRSQETHLSTWLLIVAPCMWCKEALNYWTEIRLVKISADITADADKRGKELETGKSAADAPQATRVGKSKVPRKRSSDQAEEKF